MKQGAKEGRNIKEDEILNLENNLRSIFVCFGQHRFLEVLRKTTMHRSQFSAKVRTGFPKNAK
jgi:hypothetical protein